MVSLGDFAVLSGGLLDVYEGLLQLLEVFVLVGLEVFPSALDLHLTDLNQRLVVTFLLY